jgi:hypothetical protein
MANTPLLPLGKKPFTEDKRDFKLKEVAVSLPKFPSKPFGSGSLFTDWGVLGNDKYGDCVFAGADHETMLWNRLARHDVSFVEANALADYSAVTGFNPNDPSTDQGTEVRAAMGYRRDTGLIAADGTRHKIDAYVSIDPKNWDMLIRSIWTFGAVGIGFAVPNSIWNQWSAGAVWDIVANDGGIDGGHYVPMVGYPAVDQVTFITWGKRAVMTRAFYEKYNDEAWVPLTKEELRPPSNVRNIDWDTLSSMLSSL